MRLQRSISSGPTSLVLRHGAGILAMLFGSAALIAGFWTQFGTTRTITDVSDLRIVIPLGAVALIAGIVALARREPLPGLAVGGMAMALAAPALGWVVLVGLVAAAAIVVLLVVAKLN